MGEAAELEGERERAEGVGDGGPPDGDALAPPEREVLTRAKPVL